MYGSGAVSQDCNWAFPVSRHLKPAKHNKLSTYEHPTVIDECLANEVSLGRVVSMT